MRASILRRWALAVILFGIVALQARRGAAYPQWQLSAGEGRCNTCHYAPGGGGLLTAFGRDAVGDQLSSFGGDGAFLHGAVRLPSWLSLGGDLRGAFVAHDVQDPGGPAVAVFPMQADAAARVIIPDTGLSVVGIVGLRGQVRDPDALVPLQNYQPTSTSRLVSREHYVMYQPQALGSYLRLGRFFAPFGLRFAEHTLYIRRDLGFDSLRESYNFGVGVVRSEWELHLTLFGPDVVRQLGSDEAGAAAYFERRVADGAAAFAVQGRVADGPGVTRVVGGVVGKAYVDRLKTFFFAEADAVQLRFDGAAPATRHQVVAAAGFTVMPWAGFMGTLVGERNQVDVRLDDAWTAVNAFLNWMPYAHVEAQAVGRLQHATGGEVSKTFLFQLHYFL